MREQLIIWLFILAIQGNFFAQNNAHSIRPADRVQERLASFSQQDPTPLFTRSPNRQRPTLAMTEYEIFQLDNERSASLHYRAPETLSLDVPFGGGPDLRLQLVRVDRPAPLVFESATQAPATVARAVHYQGIVAGDPTSLVALSVL